MNEISVYSFRVSAYLDELDQLKTLLSAEEMTRVSRFVFEKDAQSCIVSHALLRQLLSCELDCKPLDLVFTKNTQGKPFLRDSDIHFNVSHSGDCILISLSRGGAVGVDIEQHKQTRDVLSIAQRYFTTEEFLYIRNQVAQNRIMAFYNIWSAKEAYVKALGEGIAYGFDRFSVVNSEGGFVSSIRELFLTRLTISDGYSAAVVGSTRSIISY